MARVFNFGAGPATLPEAVLTEAQRELLDFGGTGMSIIESSHRGKAYSAVHEEAVANYRQLLGLSAEYAVIFVAGGASMQFAMVPLNLLGEGHTADYVHTGAWAGKAIKEAKRVGAVHIAADTSEAVPARIPTPADLDLTPGAAYVHLTSNETIAGSQWKGFPDTDAPLVADMSSDILSRPFDVERFALIYAGAQKNLGPSGIALVVLRRDLAERASGSLPAMLRYATYVEHDSLYNTPPTFSIYLMMLYSRWTLKEGLAALHARNVEKAARLYAAIDGSDFYTGTVAKECRSDMNVTFRLPSDELEALFMREADAQGLTGLKGHRSVGGLRASLYNAFPSAGVDALVSFMKAFESRRG
ncbi:MAG: 3-phosphoserine/phosphohydroxythreonine transaminase [Kiritimatiellae bacterium]|nr:3-phosphoserine/phosphohydroxythreonine transaminase [Kiritimatiellia bacterium]